MTAEVVRALERSGISTLLLKGPTIARWLYDRPGTRAYADIDLLVSPEDVEAAEKLLIPLGFSRWGSDLPHDRPWHAHEWIRSRDGVHVEMHRTLPGIGISPARAWDILSSDVERMRVGGIEIAALSIPARALHVALHAVSSVGQTKTLDDLELALSRLPIETWKQALDLARVLEATPPFAAGLRKLPEGRALAARLELPSHDSLELILLERSSLALGWEWLRKTPGMAAKTKLLLAKAAPPPAYLKTWSPLAGRGHWGLLIAYLWRPLWLLWKAGPTIVIWYRSKRSLVP